MIIIIIKMQELERITNQIAADKEKLTQMILQYGNEWKEVNMHNFYIQFSFQ